MSQGVVMVVALADAPAGAGGFVLVPGSHQSEVDTPAGLRSGRDDPMGMVRQPVLAAGDLLLCLASTLHGMRPWAGPGAQRLVCCEFISRTAPPSVDSAAPRAEEQADMPAWFAELDEATGPA